MTTYIVLILLVLISAWLMTPGPYILFGPKDGFSIRATVIYLCIVNLIFLGSLSSLFLLIVT